MATVYLNGEYLASERAQVSVHDRGFVFGDGIYEGVRAIRGRLFEWPAHAERMIEGLVGLRIALGAERVAALREVGEQLVHRNGLAGGEAFVYYAVTRGVAARVHAFPAEPVPPTVFASATPLSPKLELGRTGCTAITFEDMRWARCDWKTLNLLGSVLARQAASEAGAFEAILVRDGFITEGAASTVFAVLDGVLRSHPLTPRILPGVTRKVVMECVGELRIPAREAAVSLAELRSAQEIFLCGTATDVMPVVTLDGAPVASGQPGPITARLRDALFARLYGQPPANPGG
jgi:D-alanine transaminase